MADSHHHHHQQQQQQQQTSRSKLLEEVVSSALLQVESIREKYRPTSKTNEAAAGAAGDTAAADAADGGQGTSDASAAVLVRSELYQLGCTIYQNLTGCSPLVMQAEPATAAGGAAVVAAGGAAAGGGASDIAAGMDTVPIAADDHNDDGPAVPAVVGDMSISPNPHHRPRAVDIRPAKRRERSFDANTLAAAAAAGGYNDSRSGGGGIQGGGAAVTTSSLRDVGGYPVSLSLLVNDLLKLDSDDGDDDANDNVLGNNSISSICTFRRCSTTFQCLDDVDQELKRMVSNPERYLMDGGTGSSSGQLIFPPKGKLYGREDESAKLMEVFGRVLPDRTTAAAAGAGAAADAEMDTTIIDTSSGAFDASTGGSNSTNSTSAAATTAKAAEHGMVLVRGKSGAGKSALVDQLRIPLAENNHHGMMISCKFDSQVQPMSTIFQAFEEYCQNLMNTQRKNETLIASIRRDIVQGLGGVVENSNSLFSLIPSLVSLLDITAAPSSSSANDDVSDAFHRIVYSLRAFVRAVASPEHPIVILFDDLQWADRSTLDLIVMLVTDHETKSLLFLGCYRDNESSPQLEEALREIGNAKNVPVTEIYLGELDWKAVNDFVADTLHLSPHLTASLSDSIHAKTRGNPLFVVQLVKSLYDDRMLRYSASSRRWEWDIDAIRAEGIADNAVDLMLEMMRTHSDEVQWVLRVASCLGSRFDETIIKLLYLTIHDDPAGVVQHLNALVADGLLLVEGDAYKFAHDQIWEASYSLTPEEEREMIHLEVGRELMRRAGAAGEAEFESMLFTIVDQINRGSSLITDATEKIQVAELNLVAGEKASSACAFLPASIYLLQGCVFLEDNSWNDHYELSLRLHTALGEVQVAHGDNDAAIISLEPVLVHGRTIQDQLRAQHAFMLALIAQGKLNDAVEKGLKVLELLGESFPSDIDEATIKEELEKTEALIEGRTIEDILQCNIMADENKIAAMKFLTVTARIAYNSNQTFFSLPVLRMINISMANGLCPQSSFAFASAALLLCNFGHRDLATHCADISLALLKTFERQYEHVVILILGLSIHQYRQPMQACLDQLRQAGRLAIASGDVMWSIATIGFIAFNQVYVVERGKHLGDVEAEMRANIQEWSTYKHFSMDFVMLSFQAVLNLISSASDSPEDPSILTGEAMEQEKALAVFEEMNLVTLKREMYHLRMYLAYLFHRYDESAEMYELYKEVAKSTLVFPTVEVVSATFYSGLLAAAMIRNGADESVWRPVATDATTKLKEWAEKDSEWNYRHRYDLVRAELAAVDGDHDVANEAYQKAITNAGGHAFVNDQALATERTGLFCLEKGDITEAKKYLGQAKQLYKAWGSLRKADHVGVIDMQ